MNRRAMLALLLAAALLLSGCSLARPETEADAAQNEDLMVGVLVTLEPLDLFDFEAYFNDNAASLAKGGEVSAQDAEKYQNVLFAEQDGDGRYVFPEVEGYLILCTRSHAERSGVLHVGKPCGVRRYRRQLHIRGDDLLHGG